MKYRILEMMRRISMDRKMLAVIILLVALGGLGYIQYRMLDAYYTLSREKLDQQISVTLTETAEENFDRTLLSNLISSIITRDTVAFPVGIDSLRNAGTQFLRLYLTDRFARANLPANFEFAVVDQITRETYLASEEYSSGLQWLGNYKLPLAGVITQDCRCAPYLNVRFNRIETILLQGIEPIILPALGCFILLIIGFIILLRILREQKYLDQVKNDFINNLTHELKTPVFSISLATRLMREKSDGSMDKYLRQVETDIGHLKGNVEKVLELASIESRKSLLSMKRINVSEFLSTWKEELALNGTERVEWNGQTVEGQFVEADPDHLRNALGNLLENAFKYGGDLQPVRISAKADGDEIIFSVRDFGPGIDKVHQEAIFDKFYRVKNGDSTARGYGLGLSYVKQVIAMMHGSVAVKNAPDQGSIFIIKLPLVK